MADDPIDWFTNAEHAHLTGFNNAMTQEMHSQFPELVDAVIDCGCEDARHGNYTYHYRIVNVPKEKHGKVSTWLTERLAAISPYRFEVQCR